MYNKTNWLDRNVTTPGDYTITKSGGGALSSGDVVTMAESPGVVIQAGTYVIANLMNNIENGIHAVTEKSLNNEKGVNELLMLAEIDSKIIGDNNLGKYYAKAGETFSYSSGSIDFTKAYSATATQGTNTITVTEMRVGVITDFAVGMEVTLQDGSSKENLIISNVSDPTITFTSNIVNIYTGDVIVYRSNITDSGSEFNFGTLTSQTTYDRTTPVQVVNAAYSTAGNGGRKLVRLTNGELLTVTRDGVDLYLYKSEDNGLNWSLAGTRPFVGGIDQSLANNGYQVTLLTGSGSTTVASYSFDYNDLDGTDISNHSPFVSVDSGQTAIGNCSLTIAPNGDLHACWSSKNATYPNSFNIRYSKSTDGGATWSTPTQITSDNTTGHDATNPCIVIMSTGQPNIVYEYSRNTPYRAIRSYYYTTSWNLKIIYDTATTYTQANPCATVTSDGDIHIVWYGKDVTDSSFFNIRYSTSTNNGVTWASETKLTSGDTVDRTDASVTFDNSDVVYVAYDDNGTIKYKDDSDSWVATTTVQTGTDANTCENFNTFTEPLMIMDGGSDVDFYGEWIITSESDTLTEVDVRVEITPKVDSENLSAFLFFNDNFATITAKASIVDSTANETYSTMTSTDVDLGTDINEKTSTLSVVTADDRVTLKYELTRTLITDDAEITKIYGGID